MLIITCGCIRHYDTIERTVNAVWSADNTQILKIVSTYETYKPSEKYYYARASRNWRYRFETCNPDISDCEVVGSSAILIRGGFSSIHLCTGCLLYRRLSLLIHITGRYLRI
jgi:hypothetical protein